MIKISTSNGDSYEFSLAVTCDHVVQRIFPDIYDRVVAVFVNKEPRDLHTSITENSLIEPILGDSDEGKNIINRSSSFVLAMAIKSLFSDCILGMGSIADNGFFYDFSLTCSLSEKDFEDIENKINEIVIRNENFIRQSLTREEAAKLFTNDKYKLEALSDISETDVVVYRNGSFIDIAMGPLVPSSGYIKALKLTKISGAFWKGDSKNEMLQRIYGTSWHSKDALEAYQNRIKEAEKRDHRRIARDLELFHIQDEALGQVFWHAKGLTLYKVVEEYIRKNLEKCGYSEIKTPLLLDKVLWEKSGHWDKFKENMFVVSEEKKYLAIKPMNCPCHVQIFKSKTRSYKDLPIRFAEFGMCHRNEPSGSLYGLMRVRGFTQDDAHIFCTMDQIRDEVLKFHKLLLQVYKDFGFESVKVKLSDRPVNRIGSDSVWDAAEESLIQAVNDANVEYTINKGEGAFYGPKLEFVLQDAIGRDWQCGTVQVDFVLPERLEAFYIGPDGSKHHPVMIHRAILGTLERFIGILIEHYEGKFPTWLAPVQLEILPVGQEEEVLKYAEQLRQKAQQCNIRVSLNDTEESIGHKIRKSIFNKIPIVWVVGKVEASSGLVSVRSYGSKDTCSLEADKALKMLVACASIC